MHTSRIPSTRVRAVEIANLAVVAALTVLVASYFAPRGFRGGFTDMAHDGYQLRQVMDLDRGGTIFKDTFDQYGPLSGYLNVAAFRLFGRTLLAVKYALSFWYGAAAILLYLLARRLLTPAWSMASVLIWLALAPFYGHGVMISPHAYILFFQIAASLAILLFAERDSLWWLALAGACCGLCWALKTSMGVLFAIGVVAYLVVRVLDRRAGVPRGLAAVATFLGAAVCVVGVTISFLAFRGALQDWYLQTIVFPRAFYLDQIGVGVGLLSTGRTFLWNFLLLNFGPSALPLRFQWHVIRGVVVAVAIVLIRRHEAPEALLLAGCLTPPLWLGAFPSANFMHQWWTASLSIPAFVYCLRLAVEYAANNLWRGRLSRRQALVTIAILAAVFAPAIEERWDAAVNRTQTLTETIQVPKVLRGVRTDKDSMAAIHAMYEAISNYKQHHPAARIVSVDHCDGYTNCVPESLLWLSFIDDNRHDHPVYWPVPVLTDKIYPDYNARFRSNLDDTRPLIADSWNGRFRSYNTISGYQLLLGYGWESGYWYLFAPDHPEAEEHGEVVVRIEPPLPGDPVVVARKEPATSSNPTLADPEPSSVVVSEPVDPLQGIYREDMRLPIDARDTLPRRVFTWPGDADVPRLVPPVEPLNPEGAGRAKMVAVDRGRWVVRGSAETRYSYLMYFKERSIEPGQYFVAAGQLYEGGVSIGLQYHDQWKGIVNVTTPGPFAIVMRPDPGRYNLVIANNVPTHTWKEMIRQHGPMGIWEALNGAVRPNWFVLDRVGWTTPAAPVATR